MKKVYRGENNADYWDRRWAEAGRDRDRFEDLTIYPIRYAEMVMTDPGAKAVEIGCGLGRVLKHYRNQGFDVVGIERSPVAVTNLQAEIGKDVALQGDALGLPFPDGSFDVVMAFGVYHNLETGLADGLAELARILRPGGRFCVSMRPDNVEMFLNELFWRHRNRRTAGGEKQFHKLLVGEKEFVAMLADAGLANERILRARNVSILYRLPFLRDKQGSEGDRRARGYRLNSLGRLLDRILRWAFPYQTANVLVFIGRRTETVT